MSKVSGTEYTSCDAPPLDFSFKNIKNLEGISLLMQKSKSLSQGKEKDLTQLMKMEDH